ncbi:MAG: hypothetical protein AAGI07_17560 [Bacteroidota bacterium]
MDKNLLNKLASSLGRRDEMPNQELAKQIVVVSDTASIKVLVESLQDKNRAIQNDCIKVLYEIGVLQPELISDYSDSFLSLLNSKNNRLQWGGMTALHCITALKPDEIYAKLPQIIEAADKGSVITKDYAVNILISLAAVPKYTDGAIGLLKEQLLKSPVNQLPMYAEKVLPVIKKPYQDDFIKLLQERLNDVEKESKRKRIEKVIKKLLS